MRSSEETDPPEVALLKRDACPGRVCCCPWGSLQFQWWLLPQRFCWPPGTESQQELGQRQCNLQRQPMESEFMVCRSLPAGTGGCVYLQLHGRRAWIQKSMKGTSVYSSCLLLAIFHPYTLKVTSSSPSEFTGTRSNKAPHGNRTPGPRAHVWYLMAERLHQCSGATDHWPLGHLHPAYRPCTLWVAYVSLGPTLSQYLLLRGLRQTQCLKMETFQLPLVPVNPNVYPFKIEMIFTAFKVELPQLSIVKELHETRLLLC